MRGNERFITVRVSDQALRRSIALVSRHDRALAPEARALWGFLEERLGQGRGWWIKDVWHSQEYGERLKERQNRRDHLRRVNRFQLILAR